MSIHAKEVRFLHKIRMRWETSTVGHILLHFLELQIPMVFGALVCYLLGRLIAASSTYAAVYHPGTLLFMIGDVLYLSLPVVVWMMVRGHGWHYSLRMAAAMIAPVVAIVVAGPFTTYDYLLWLVTAMYPAMCLGMLAFLFYCRGRLTKQVR